MQTTELNMIVGILKEIKSEENRVSMTPVGVEIMNQNGHDILIEKNAGRGSGFSDVRYKNAGAKIISNPADIYQQADMIMHVKEPQPTE
jgi:alanine dehydrogenase